MNVHNPMIRGYLSPLLQCVLVSVTEANDNDGDNDYLGQMLLFRYCPTPLAERACVKLACTHTFVCYVCTRERERGKKIDDAIFFCQYPCRCAFLNAYPITILLPMSARGRCKLFSPGRGIDFFSSPLFSLRYIFHMVQFAFPLPTPSFNGTVVLTWDRYSSTYVCWLFGVVERWHYLPSPTVMK